MVFRLFLPGLLFLFGSLAGYAQLGGSGNLRVRVTLPDDRPAPRDVMVQLMNGSSNTPIATSYTNDQGFASFGSVAAGMYELTLTGDGLERTTSSMFEVDARKLTQVEYVTVQPSRRTAQTSAPMVSAATLSLSDSARKEFQRASDAMSHDNWGQAKDSLQRVIGASPHYAPAYNNIALVYRHMNDAVQERAALEKAISLDEHYAAPNLNLGELCIRERRYADAESLLERAAALDPMNAKVYVLLGDAQVMEQKYEAALNSEKRAHSLPHEHLAIAHYIAAQVYERMNQPREAVVELQTFLKEEPQGPRADKVKSELSQLEARVR